MKGDKKKIEALLSLPFFELVDQARAVHKQYFNLSDIELCKLLSIKTGACPEDCAYCPQSAHYNTGLEKEALLSVENVLEKARLAKQEGAKRFCLGAAWKHPPKKDFSKVLEMIKGVKSLGLETCVTLGQLSIEQAQQLKSAGLDYYNHNLDTSRRFYKTIISTRQFDERIETINHVAETDIKVCCGGILGMGETHEDRVNFLLELAALPIAPQSIPINKLIVIKGTPLEEAKPIEDFEFIKMIAVTRILFPTSRVRLSAGRESMSSAMQAWCFMVGANSIFIGDKLLTSKNNGAQKDLDLLRVLGLNLNDETFKSKDQSVA